MPKILFTAAQIDKQIDRLAQNLRRDHPENKPIFVALLRGAAPFAAKLMFAISRQDPDYHPEIDYMMVSTYGSGRQAGQPHIVTDLAPTTDVTGRTVVVIDDVLDKGITADFVSGHLRGLGAGDVRLAVLVDKQAERHVQVTADYACLTSPDVWLVGMGMDDGSLPESYRWREDILEI